MTPLTPTLPASTDRDVPHAARAQGSEREPTAPDSTAQLHDPAWEPTLRDKMQPYRHATVPGWFDRIDGKALKENSIASIRDHYDQAALRRRIAGGVVLHTTTLTALVALCVYTPAIARSLRLSFAAPWKICLLTSSLLIQIVLLKLVLDVPRLRTLVFSINTVSLAVLLSAIQFMWASPDDMIVCCVIVTLTTALHFVLCGVQYRRAFLGFTTLWTLESLVAGAGLGIARTVPMTFQPEGAMFLAICGVLVVTFCLVYETLEFLPKLTPNEAPLGVYLIYVDIAAVVFYTIRWAVFYSVAIVGLLLMGCIAEPLVAGVKFICCGGWRSFRVLPACEATACGLDCNCTRQPRAAQVAVVASAPPDAVAVHDAPMDR